MERYKEWKEKGYKIGAAWGLFSCGIPHRVSMDIYVDLEFILILFLLLGRLSMYELLS